MLSRLARAASRCSGSGGTYQTPTPEGAVAPLVPQKPLSTSTTRAPRAAAAHAAHVPPGPPPITSTSASRFKQSALTLPSSPFPQPTSEALCSLRVSSTESVILVTPGQRQNATRPASQSLSIIIDTSQSKCRLGPAPTRGGGC